MTQLASESLVTVFGGSGFIGRHVVRALAKRGYRVRVAVRRPDLALFLQPLGRVGQIYAEQANLRYPASVASALRGAVAAVNLVGIGFERGRQRFSSVQAEGAAAIAQAAAAQGVRLTHVSAIGADAQARSGYARSKAQGEAAVHDALPAAVVLRPSVVFGPEDEFFNRFAGLARFSPFLPLIGGGRCRLQPVYVNDVAEVIARAVDGSLKDGTIYELGGPEVMTVRDIMRFVLDTTERRRLLLPVPFPIATLQAKILQLMPKPLVTPEQVELLRHDNVVSAEAEREGRTLKGIGIEPAAVAAIVPSYLWRYRKAGQFTRRTGAAQPNP